ncbi:unnamed protein product, partial [Effrenium voratum]
EFGSGSGEMLSIAEEPKEAVNPFADEDPFQDIEPEEAPVAARPTAVSFAPPRRGSSGLRNPFDDDASSQASEDLPAGHIASGGGSFGRASGGILPLPEMPEESVREAGLEAAEEVRSLRRALISEEAACAQAKAELEAQLQAAEASEAGSLRRRLAEEKAKSRALGERAIRSERHRQKLLEEIVEDGQMDVEFASLVKAVGRTAKAIGAISREAPRLSKLAQAPLTEVPARLEPRPASPRLTRLPTPAELAAAQSA